MRKEIYIRYCDRCGREIHGYSCGKEFFSVDDMGDGEIDAMDFCISCTLSFQKWMDAIHDENILKEEREYSMKMHPAAEKEYEKRKEKEHKLRQEMIDGVYENEN